MAHLLLIDTSAQRCLVGLTKDFQLLGALAHDDQKTQSAVINSMIEQLSKTYHVPLQKLDAIAVCSGPGSYTGLRIALGTAKGLAMGLNKPIILHNKLELMAFQATQQTDDYWYYSSVLQAREDEFYYATYDAEMQIVHQPIHGSTAYVANELEKLNKSTTLLTGDANSEAIFGERLQLNDLLIPELWSAYAFNAFQRQQFANVAYCEPFYMKDVYVIPKKKN